MATPHELDTTAVRRRAGHHTGSVEPLGKGPRTATTISGIRAGLPRIETNRNYSLKPEELRVWRQQMGYSQAQIARMLFVTQQHWSGWETGARKPPFMLSIVLHCLRNHR